MSAPLVPSPLDYIGRRGFSFYPPIKNVGPNEWVLGGSSWSEVQAVNLCSGRELWVARQYVGAVSETSDALVVGLTKELEYRAGALSPRVKRVIEMPHQETDRSELPVGEPRHSSGPASVVGIRIEDRADSSMNRALVTLGIGALVMSVLAALLSGLARF